LIEISSDYELKLRFKSLSLNKVWLSVRKEKPLPAGKVTTTLLPFSTTYLCEKAFSSYTNLQTKQRNRLNAEPDLKLFFLWWYRTTKHYADENNLILHIEVFVQGCYRLRQIS
jgi:hypothetical protein